MLEDLLARRERYLREQAEQHDTDDFINRLADRIARESHRPARVSYAVTDTVQHQAGGTATETRPVLQLSPPAPGPDTAAARPRGSTRPGRRTRRRRPTPIITPNPAASKIAVLAYVQLLCDQVLQSTDIDALADFATDYGEVGARTFACLLYNLERRESALYWWGFAAGVGDPLAAHLLAAYHAAAGQGPEARMWRANARLLGFSSEHLPHPVRRSTESAECYTRQMPWDTEVKYFMGATRLPQELLR
ncbi:MULTISPECIES: hypothetical protein [unclassified Streptomyces]|uniref:hypothetical protein n=1 Tax=unclassified Streptomyces TaxID=2593676 RepID=UPI0035DA1D89